MNKTEIKSQVTQAIASDPVDLTSYIRMQLAPYLKLIGEPNIELTPAYDSKSTYKGKTYHVKWFNFLGRCPICQNKNENGWCCVGVQMEKPHGMRFHCNRYGKILNLQRHNNRDYVLVPMGKDSNGKNIFDVYKRASKVKNTTAIWMRDSKQSQSNFNTKIEINSNEFKDSHLRAKLASSEQIDIMNRFVLGKYKLSKEHHRNLLDRGFSEEDLLSLPQGTGFGSFDKGKLYEKYDEHNHILPFMFKSFSKGTQFNPTFEKDGYLSIWQRKLAENRQGLIAMGFSEKQAKNLWYGVPGFFLHSVEFADGKSKKVPYFASSNGMLVPYYNTNNQLVGFQVRKDFTPLSNPKAFDEDLRDFDEAKDGFKIEVQFPAKYPDGKKVTNGRYYQVVITKNGNAKVIKKGTVYKLNKWIYASHELRNIGINKRFRFKVTGKEGNKYNWASSGSINYAGDSKESAAIYGVHVRRITEVAYQPKIAVLPPNSKELVEYRNSPKNIWVTEGGLKALLAVRKLEKHFTNEELDKYGHDILGIPGVNTITGNKDNNGINEDFQSILTKLNVRNITLAFDMDMFENDNVMKSTLEAAKLLSENGYGIRIALWNRRTGKGIDDILVTDNCKFEFYDIGIK